MSFVTPLFAALAAALVAVPVVIHLLNRRRFRTVDFAAMQFLLAAVRRNRRRLRFESWLLLATRCLAIALLALALARPIGCARGDSALAALGGDEPGLTVVVLDDSGSTRWADSAAGGRTNFERARDAAKRVLTREAGGSRAVAVVLASRPARVLVRPTYDLATDALDDVQPTYAATDLPGALRLARELVDAERAPARRVHVVTDSASAALRDDGQALKDAAAAVARSARLAYVDVGSANQSNAAVTDLRPLAALVRGGFAGEVSATLRGYGATQSLQLDWLQDARPLPGGGPVAPDATTAPQVNGAADFTQGGVTVVTARLAGSSALPHDDVRRRAVDVAAELPVLIVEGRRGLEALSGSGAFLRLALAPAEGAAGYVKPELISDLELPGRPLGAYRAVVLAGVGNLAEPTGDALAQYVRNGGALLTFMGDAVAPARYNELLLPRGLLPGPIEQRRDAVEPDSFFFDFDAAAPHPALAAFRNYDRTGLDTAPIFSYLKLAVNDGAERVLNFRGTGDPAVALHALGAGRVVTVATSAEPAWGGLIVKPAFVTLAHELLAAAAGGDDSWLNLEVGDRLVVPARVRLSGLPALRGPRDDASPVPLARVDDSWQSEPLTEPGQYALAAGAATWPIVVNPPAAEADVRHLDEGQVRDALGDVEFTYLRDAPGTDAPAAPTGEPRDASWPMLIAVLGLIGAETAMAFAFGRAGRGAP